MTDALNVIYLNNHEIMASGSEFKIKEIRGFVKSHVGISARELQLLPFMSSKTMVRYKIDDPKLMAEIKRRYPRMY